MNSQIQGFDISRYIDEIALAAFQAYIEEVEKSQVNKLIEYLESTDSFTLVLYLARQVARGYWGSRRSLSASRLLKIIDDVLSKLPEEESRKIVLRKVLGYFKWFYEISEHIFTRNVSVAKGLQQKFSTVLSNPKASAPSDFAKILISSMFS